MHGEAEAQLGEWLPSRFPFIEDPVVSLVRAYTNDVYRVADRQGHFALKIYGTGWRTDDEIRYELDLLHHLADRGIAVASAIPDRDGSAFVHLQVEGETRQAVLFAWASGTKPPPPFTLAMYYREGQATAALHAASDDFASPHVRQPVDVQALIEVPRGLIASVAGSTAAGCFLDRFGLALAVTIARAADAGLDWGPVHGDLTFDNFHLTEDGETVWYDFDSGGSGWRAMDLQGWVALDPGMQERQDAFVAGYRTERLLDERDVAASGLIAAAEAYWGIGIDLRFRVRQRGAEAVAAYLDEQATAMRRWAMALGISHEDW